MPTRVCIVLFCLVYLGCSAKKDGFLTAEDGKRDFSLPNQTLVSLYPVPALNPSAPSIDFVSRPRPLPGFIGLPPPAYEQEVTQLREERLVSLRLGYNSNQEASLLIEPYGLSDFPSIEKTLAELGFAKQEESLYVDDQAAIKLYFYPSALLLSLVGTKRSDDEFARLDQVRTTWQE